jgi:hypothetical protein
MESLEAPVSKIRRRTVEYSLTEHCNLSCYNCDHASPLLPEKFAALAEFERDIRALAKVMSLRELTLIGGEPLLHPQLLDFIRIGRDSGVADKIVVFTNGVLLHTMPDEFWELTDILRITRYPGIKHRLSAEEISAKCARFGVECDMYALVSEFGRTVLNAPIEDPALVRKVFRECKMAHEWQCLSLNDGRFFRCSVAPFMDKRLRRLGIDFDSNSVDGVQVAGNPRLYEEIEAALTQKEPLKACTYCLGKSGPMIPHRQMNRQACKAWMEEDDSADIEFARRNVGRQAMERRLLNARSLAGRAVRKGRRILASLSR